LNDPVALFAGIYVSDYEIARAWYVCVFGAEPSLLPNDTEAVWEVAESRSVYINLNPRHAGHSVVTLFVDDLDERVAEIAERGIEPARQETYHNGVRKIVYRDPDGNEVGFGGAGRRGGGSGPP
jgi:catechol 2,3-dioxygenase-like lactoylglutathione lyase family enzyme